MTKNDAIIVKMLGNINLTASEENAKTALMAAADAMETYEKAKDGSLDREVPEGVLHCDDALNKGCITIEGPMGMSFKRSLRAASAPEIKAMIGELHSLELAEKAAGTSFAERGHTVSEWKEDLEVVWTTCHATCAELLNTVEAKKALALKACEEHDKAIENRNNLVSMLSKEYILETENALELIAMCEANPELAVGVTPPVVDVKPYDIPDEVKELYAKVFRPAPCECDCDEDYDDECEYDEDNPW